MPRRLIALVVMLLVGVVGLAGCGSSPDVTAAADKAASDTSPYAFTARTLDGKDFDGQSLKGKPTVLWFWAPWCPTCLRQAEGVRKALAADGTRVNLLGVAGLDSEAAMAEFVAKAKIDGLTSLSDEPGVLWKKFEVTEQSTFVLLDASGAVVGREQFNAKEIPGRVKTLAAG